MCARNAHQRRSAHKLIVRLRNCARLDHQPQLFSCKHFLLGFLLRFVAIARHCCAARRGGRCVIAAAEIEAELASEVHLSNRKLELLLTKQQHWRKATTVRMQRLGSDLLQNA